MMNKYVVYNVVLNNQIVLANIIEWNTLEVIQEEWKSRGMDVMLLSTGTN